MKLNNKGWGTIEMLLLSSGLLLSLIVAIFFISELYSNFDDSSGKNYVDLENKLEVAGKKYVDENDINVSGEYKISLETLQTNNVIEEFRDADGNKCNGYVTVINVDNINHYKGYISCNSYETQNY